MINICRTWCWQQIGSHFSRYTSPLNSSRDIVLGQFKLKAVSGFQTGGTPLYNRMYTAFTHMHKTMQYGVVLCGTRPSYVSYLIASIPNAPVIRQHIRCSSSHDFRGLTCCLSFSQTLPILKSLFVGKSIGMADASAQLAIVVQY